MGMSEFYGETDDDESVATLRRALDLGVTFIDTSDLYGTRRTTSSSSGRAIAGRRDEVQLATKFGIRRDGDERWIDNSPEWIREACERLAAAPGHRPHRPLLHAPPQSGRPDRGERRRDRGAR